MGERGGRRKGGVPVIISLSYIGQCLEATICEVRTSGRLELLQVSTECPQLLQSDVSERLTARKVQTLKLRTVLTDGTNSIVCYCLKNVRYKYMHVHVQVN